MRGSVLSTGNPVTHETNCLRLSYTRRDRNVIVKQTSIYTDVLSDCGNCCQEIKGERA